MGDRARTVVLLGTLDTKGVEYGYVRDRLHAAGVGTCVVDAGVLGEPPFAPDVTAGEVAAAAGSRLSDLLARRDRGVAVAAMAEGAAAVVARLYREGHCDGALALGGTGGTAIAARAFRELPLGVPKVIVTTAAAGDTTGYIGQSDLVLMPSVVDIAGINRLSARILANAAAAVGGMVTGPPPPADAGKPMVAASMFGVTTPCVTAARARLEELGYEVLVFHMTGTGGRMLESLAAHGMLVGVLDITTTELADELVGGVFSAGPGRLTAAGAAGIAQVVSVGALDMVNFGPIGSVPDRFAGRNLYVHNPQVTLLRTTPAECAELGTRLAARLAIARGPVSVFLPLRGVSAIATPGGPFADAAADAALFDAIRTGLSGTGVELIERDTDVNDPAFATEMADRLHAHLRAPAAERGAAR